MYMRLVLMQFSVFRDLVKMVVEKMIYTLIKEADG